MLTHHLSSTCIRLGKNPQESVLDRLPNRTKDELLHVSSLFFFPFMFFSHNINVLGYTWLSYQIMQGII